MKSRGFGTVLVLAAVALAACGPAGGSPSALPAGPSPSTRGEQGPSVVVAFDFEAGELPQGLAVDPQGNVYVGMPVTGEIKKVTPDGGVSTFARLPEPGVLGLAWLEPLGLFVALATSHPESHGLWLLGPSGRPATPPFAPLDSRGFPDGVAVAPGPLVFVSDSALSRIWTFHPEPDPAGRLVPTGAVWKEDPLLTGNPEALRGIRGFAVGADCIALRDGYVYVANTDYGRILRIPVLPGAEDLERSTPGGSPFANPQAGEVEVFVENPALLDGANGIAFDSLGNLYVAVNVPNRLVRVSPDREITILAEGDPLQYPASLAFGAGSEQANLYITNYPIPYTMGFASGTPRPALLTMPVGVPGEPVPTMPPPATGPGPRQLPGGSDMGMPESPDV